MLCTELRLNQSFTIADSKIKLERISRNKIKLSIDPSPDVKIEFEKKDSLQKNKGKSQ